jgi:hypothetical protein
MSRPRKNYKVVKFNGPFFDQPDPDNPDSMTGIEHCNSLSEASRVAFNACRLYEKVVVLLTGDISEPVFELNNVRDE